MNGKGTLQNRQRWVKLLQGKQLVSILKTFLKLQCTFLPVLAFIS